MRVFSIIACLLFFLFSGSGTALARENNAAFPKTTLANLEESDQSKMASDTPNLSFFEDSDVHFEEELQHDDASGESNAPVAGHSFFPIVYREYCPSVFIQYEKPEGVFPHFYGNSCPIYIAQRVLRI